MPLYDYRCDDNKCKHEFEKKVPMADYDKSQICPECKSSAKKYMKSSGGFILKGGGWTGRLGK